MLLKSDKLLLLTFCILLLAEIRSQTDFENYYWNSGQFWADTSLFKDEDLLILMNSRIIDNAMLKDYYNYFSPEVVKVMPFTPISFEFHYMQMYVRSQRGARMIWQMQIPTMHKRVLERIKLRNRKPDGKIIDLEPEDIRYVANKTLKTENFDPDYTFIPVPGVDAGDIVEMLAIYYIPGTLVSDEVFFHSYYPVCRSEFIYNHTQDYHISLSKYNFNNFNYTDTASSEAGFKFEFDNLPGLYSQQGIIPQFELPFVAFRIDSIFYKTPFGSVEVPIVPSEWTSYHKKSIKDIMTGPNKISEKVLTENGNFFNVFKKRFPESDNFQLAIDWHNFLNDSIALRFISAKSGNLPLEYWLERRSVDRTRLLSLYLEFFDYHKIDYSVYISRNVGYGYFDTTFVSFAQGLELFFGIHNHDQTKFLYPHYEVECFPPGELPIALKGALAIGYRPSSPDSSMEIIDIPFLKKDENFKKRKYDCSVTDPKSERLSVKQRNIYSGEFGNATSNLYKQLFTGEKDETVFENFFVGDPGNLVLKTFHIDSITSEIPGFSFTFEYERDNFLTSHSDSSYSFRLEDVSSLDELPYLPFKRQYGYYLTTPYSNYSKFYMRFNQKVELIGNDTVFEYSNGFGSVSLTARIMNENIILIDTYYSAELNYLPAEEYWRIKDLTDKADEMLSLHLFFRFINE
jgi:hypothetical protein